MSRLMKKNLNKITSENLAPPYKDYEYFKNCDELPFRYRSNRFDMVNAWWLIEVATLVYAEPQFATEIFKREAQFKEVAYFSGKTTQCFIVSNEKFAIVAFRGSEIQLREGDSDPSHIFADWLANFNFLPDHWKQGGNVHRGFKAALDEVWSEIENYISNLRKTNRKIWMTGHSLGAALATLAASRDPNVQGLYTYGSPRVGDLDFKNNFKERAYRFVNNNDLVTKVPPGKMYCHVGKLKNIDGKGSIYDSLERGERWSEEIQDQFKNIVNAIGQSANGFTEVLLQPVIDHVPIRYAIHIWNNIPQVGH